MTPEQWRRAFEEFSACCAAGVDRAGFIARLRQQDPEVGAAVEEMLRADAAADETVAAAKWKSMAAVGAVLHGAAPAVKSSRDSNADYPLQIGKYRVLKQIGTGGMGLVLLAIRIDDQIRTRVAIKLIKRGMDTDAVLRRFETERQVLGGMNHPSIARYMDAGALPDGRPFLIMEYVDGLPIDLYCDRNRLSMRERLGLFRRVCDAVHHAHQNLVVHRDLKPSNILVTSDGAPKLLDFGIAKLLNPAMVGVTLATEPGAQLMTPPYASPEQVRGEPVTTATDVYSLGVVLYELLTGHRPIRFRTTQREEIIRAVCEEDPERPSTRVTRPPEPGEKPTNDHPTDPDKIARLRAADLRSLQRSLRGELDSIILKTLEKVPRHRYGSVQEFSDDLERFLDGRPIRAQRQTWRYRARKTLYRHRIAFGTVALVSIVVLGSLAVSLVQWRRAAREKDARMAVVNAIVEPFREKLARIEGGTAARLALAETLLDLARSNQSVLADGQLLSLLFDAADFFTSVRSPGPRNFEQAELILDELAALLKLAPAELQTQFDPLLKIYRADLERERDDYVAAKALLETAIEQLRSLDGPTARRRHAAALSSLATIFEAEQRASEALSYVQQSLQIRRELHQAAPENEQYLRDYLIGLRDEGSLLAAAGEGNRARDRLEEAVRLARRLFKRQPDARSKRDLAISLNKLADFIGRVDPGAALTAQGEAVRIYQELVTASPFDVRTRRETLDQTIGYVIVLRDNGHLADALHAVTPMMAAATACLDAAPDDRRALIDYGRAVQAWEYAAPGAPSVDEVDRALEGLERLSENDREAPFVRELNQRLKQIRALRSRSGRERAD